MFAPFTSLGRIVGTGGVRQQTSKLMEFSEGNVTDDTHL